jgi:ketosteroid isomerase-like protein
MKSSQTIQQFRQLMTDGDQDAAFDMIAEDAYWHVDEIGAPWSGVFNGRKSIIEHFAKISGTTKDFKRHIDKIIEDEEYIIEIGSLSCVLVKTGEPFYTEYVSVYKVQAGKITYYRIYEDSLKLYLAYNKV